MKLRFRGEGCSVGMGQYTAACFSFRNSIRTLPRLSKLAPPLTYLGSVVGTVSSAHQEGEADMMETFNTLGFPITMKHGRKFVFNPLESLWKITMRTSQDVNRARQKRSSRAGTTLMIKSHLGCRYMRTAVMHRPKSSPWKT